MKKYAFSLTCLLALTGVIAGGAAAYAGDVEKNLISTALSLPKHDIIAPAGYLAYGETAATPCVSRESSNPGDSVILILLSPYIDKAIDEYYGEFRQNALYDAKIDLIERNGTDFSYTVTVSVPTFDGPHNPPYGLETIVFSLKPGGKVTTLDYRHTDLVP